MPRAFQIRPALHWEVVESVRLRKKGAVKEQGVGSTTWPAATLTSDAADWTNPYQNRCKSL